jgi:hypothetical protein
MVESQTVRNKGASDDICKSIPGCSAATIAPGLPCVDDALLSRLILDWLDC